MVSFEIFVKSMPPSLSELKVLPSFCFAFKIPDYVTVTTVTIGSYFASKIPSKILSNENKKTGVSKKIVCFGILIHVLS